MTNSIEIHGLRKSYPDFTLGDIDLTLPGGSIMGLIGENGAGKTTTIKCILNLVRLDAGSITVMGHDSVREERLAKADTGVVLDECFFHDSLRPRDADGILSRVYPAWDSQLYRRYLEKFKLPEQKYVKEFSRGMKMKLSLAAALAFISDEEHSILISSHITSDLEKVADYIAYIHQGQVALSGAKDEILERYGRMACAAAQLEGVDPADLVRVRRGEFGCEALVADRAAFAQKYPGLLVERATLEEVMLFIGKGEAK